MSEDRSEELAAVMLEFVFQLANDQETDVAILAKLAEDCLYECYPDVTTQELEAIALIFRDSILDL
jgi:hypothetical protein